MSRVLRVRVHARAPAQVAVPAGAPRRRLTPSQYRPATEVRDDGAVSVRARALSAELVEGHWVDHTDPDHLKAAVELFDALPVMPMHDADPRNLLGHAGGGTWDDTLLGPQQAAGINVEASVDPSLSDGARTAAAGVRLGVLTRWSLGFLMDGEVSHPAMSDEEFAMQLGAERDGEIVRLIAKEILDVIELSLVDAGAIESARTLSTSVLPWTVVSRPQVFAAPRRRYNPPVRRKEKIA